MTRYGMVIDLDRCTGCRACMVACKVENNTPEGSFWMYVKRYEEGSFPNTRMGFMPRPCMHCSNAPCIKVCPVGARYKRLDGLTATDWERCIGCRYCQLACPYDVNYFNWTKPQGRQYLDWEGEHLPYENPHLAEASSEDGRHVAGGNHEVGVMGKCTFCPQRVEKGLDPACVEACPTRVLQFGDLDDPSSEVSKLRALKPAKRLLEELGTEPNVYYVGEVGLPTHGAREIEPVVSSISSGRKQP